MQGETEVAVQIGMFVTVAEADVLEFDAAPCPALCARRRQGIGFVGYIHQVTQTLHSNVRLLEFLPQTGQAKHGLCHARSEHLEGDQHADGEAVVLHHQQCTDHQNG